MSVYRNFAHTALALVFVGLAASAHAGVVVFTNLAEPARVSSTNAYVGQSLIAGNIDQTLFGAQMQLNKAEAPSSFIELEVEARNANGTVGQTLFDNFSSSYNAATGMITFQANSNFVLTAGTGYWLVLSDAPAHGVNWDFTAINVYQSEFGYGLPSFSTSWISTADNGGGSSSTYYDPSDGPQIFQLVTFGASAVPEPSSVILGAVAAALLGCAAWYQRARSIRCERATLAR